MVGRHVFLRKWERGLKLNKESVSRIPVWTQLHNVLVEYWTPEGLSSVASVVGVPLYAAEATENFRRINYARICIDLDASRPLVKEFEVITHRFEQGSLVKGKAIIKVAYQWKPPACLDCRIFGHYLEDCRHISQSGEDNVKSGVEQVQIQALEQSSPPLSTENTSPKRMSSGGKANSEETKGDSNRERWQVVERKKDCFSQCSSRKGVRISQWGILRLGPLRAQSYSFLLRIRIQN